MFFRVYNDWLVFFFRSIYVLIYFDFQGCVNMVDVMEKVVIFCEVMVEVVVCMCLEIL